MSHKGLNKEIIIKAAADLIETQGRECFSMRLLADSLQVKTASLYNHIKSMDELITAVVAFRAKCKMFSRHLQKPILKTEKGRFKGL